MFRRPAIACLFIFLTACGYVGPVQPPSPNIPGPVLDLVALERGDKIVITFNTPARTTDGVAITHFAGIDVRIAPEGKQPEAGKSYPVELPPPSDREDPQPKPISLLVDVSDWAGQTVVVLARTAFKKEGHYSSWSNRAVLEVMPPLPKPVVKAEASAAGIVLNWPATTSAEFRIQRQGPADKQPIDLATTLDNHYTDISAQYDTEYHYTVTAQIRAAQSPPSDPIAYTAIDIFPPAVPSGLTALVGPEAVELAWQRNAEPDFQAYYIYRSTNNGPFQRLGDPVNLPAFTDHTVEHGKTYAYKLSAIDKKGNESTQSSPTEVQF